MSLGDIHSDVISSALWLAVSGVLNVVVYCS